MDIEVGEYVRLARNQGINKIIDKDYVFDDGFLILDVVIMDEYGEECFQISLEDVNEEIIKHSKNIIDLIEVGDYVNGKYVSEIKEYKDGKALLTLIGIIMEDDIKTIVTHEQYQQNCYTIERKK